MKQLTILDNEKFLRQVSKPVDFKVDNVKECINTLEKFCLENQVLAMASVQLGIPLRVIYLKNTDLDNLDDENYNEAQVLINPEIISRIGHTTFWEACASCLDNTGLVHRPYEIKVKYLDVNQNEHIKVFKGFEATVFSHEYDHLDGILHIDIAEEILVMSKEERKEFRKTHNYEILSKTCNYDDINKY